MQNDKCGLFLAYIFVFFFLLKTFLVFYDFPTHPPIERRNRPAVWMIHNILDRLIITRIFVCVPLDSNFLANVKGWRGLFVSTCLYGFYHSIVFENFPYYTTNIPAFSTYCWTMYGNTEGVLTCAAFRNKTSTASRPISSAPS